MDVCICVSVVSERERGLHVGGVLGRDNQTKEGRKEGTSKTYQIAVNQVAAVG